MTAVCGVWLARTRVPEPARREAAAGMADCFRLLREPAVAVAAFGIGAFIAADVGIGFLSSRLLARPDSILTTTGFYACRIVGTLVGAWVLLRFSDIRYLRWNMCAAAVLVALLLFVRGDAAVYVLIGLLGFTLSCVFATFYAVATRHAPGRSNEVAGLSIMMIAAGALSGPVIGLIARLAGGMRFGLLYVLACVLYLVWASFRLEPNNIINKENHA